MYSDPLHDVVRLGDCQQRLQSLCTSSIRLQTQRDALLRDHEKATSEVDRLSRSIDCWTKTGELLRALLDKLVLDQIRAVESVVTEGLRSIFFDQDLSFQADVGQSRGKIAIDLLIRRVHKGVEIVGPPLETMGGGVSSIASLTLRILALMRLKKFPLLVLDETLSAVSSDYVEPTGQFLARLAEVTDVPILLVTHNQSFLDHAKTAYHGSLADASFSLRQIRGAS